MIKKLYGYDENPLYHNDIINMERVYINEARNTLVGAFDKDNNLIGTIAVRQYEERIEAIKGIYDAYKTAELGRCYIKENLRRKGIGSLLFNEIVKFCKNSEYEIIYLHTHKHLPGGFDFWKKTGFLIKIEESNEEETVHMEKNILE
ncbi:GNAT family N-acetyltransferase [Tepidibacter mesophilus]|uniref:GNAT family N-acetyltransferase n=1 Tax=Tepidibacter mesophilus TaxID=655607 RepID=UPI0016517CC6|nr:GNAT family N-acetyltransferase [Tepidibacter mesophilus]